MPQFAKPLHNGRMTQETLTQIKGICTANATPTNALPQTSIRKEISVIVATEYSVTESIPTHGAGYADIRIKYVPPFISCVGDKPAFWYVSRPTRSETQYRAGLKVDYWTSTGWNSHAPTQFPSAESAYEALKDGISQ
jgi:hypothetical protein